MIVSDLESIVWNLVLGGVLDLAGRGEYTPEVAAFIEGILAWMETPGATPAAREELEKSARSRKCGA